MARYTDLGALGARTACGVWVLASVNLRVTLARRDRNFSFFLHGKVADNYACLSHNKSMKRTQPNRTVSPVAPRPDAEVVFKRISPLSPGCMVCTVSYLKSTSPVEPPTEKPRLLPRFALILGKIRGVFLAKLNNLRGKSHSSRPQIEWIEKDRAGKPEK